MSGGPRPPLTDLSAFGTPAEPLLQVARHADAQGRATAAHRHAPGQLLGVRSGLISVATEAGRWVAPAAHAVWIPPRCLHGLQSFGPYDGWNVYVAHAGCAELPAQPCSLRLTPLLKAGIDRAAGWPQGPRDEREQRLARVIVDEIAALPRVRLELPMPVDTRLQRVAGALLQRLDDVRPLDAWAELAAMSPRNFARRFAQETACPFGRWRRRARMLGALELLNDGRAVKAAALCVGYDDAGTFIAQFRREFGCTPGEYVMPRSPD